MVSEPRYRSPSRSTTERKDNVRYRPDAAPAVQNPDVFGS
jgi:hypothetical protein